MSKRAWITAITLGLIGFVQSGQAQDEADSEQGQTRQQQQPAQSYPLPFPVEIIEDQAEANARYRREAEARQNQIDDLAAQQGMNVATQAMNEATQRMVLYNLISTVLVGVGTVLLIITLFLTRQANKAAQAGVAVTRHLGKIQTEAYLSVTNSGIGNGPRHPITQQTVGCGLAPTGVVLANRGQSPAIIESCDAHVSILAHGELLHSHDLPATIEQRAIEAGGSGVLRADIPNCFLVGDNFTLLEDAKAIVQVSVDYRTRFEDLDRITYECQMKMVCARPIIPEIIIEFQPDPLNPPWFKLERIEKAKADYEDK